MNRPAQLELVGRKIRQLRRQRKLTQVELAEKIGIHQSDLSRMEQGEYKVGLDTLLKILQCFDLSIGDFFEETSRSNTVLEKFRTLSTAAQKEVETFIEFKRSQEEGGDFDGGDGGRMLRQDIMKAEELRVAALAQVRAARYEEALHLYDEALAIAEEEETRELITINKADALIASERTGSEVQELPRIIMRRRNPRHVYLAAYALQYKCRLENDLKRALFYAQLALRTAEEAGEPSWRRVVLLELGNIHELDSQIDKAVDCFKESLAIGEESPANRDKDLSHSYALENLGYCLMLQGKTEEGLAFVHEALTMLSDPIGKAEAYIDLCYGYIAFGDFQRARKYGEAGLELATEPRQIRNSHYLLGEACYKSGDREAADFHFSELAKFYPQFRNLKNLLYAIDLRSMVNFKL